MCKKIPHQVLKEVSSLGKDLHTYGLGLLRSLTKWVPIERLFCQNRTQNTTVGSQVKKKSWVACQWPKMGVHIIMISNFGSF